MANDALSIFNKQYNALSDSKNGKLSPKRDAIIRDDSFTELSKVSLKHDKPDYVSGKKTFNAIVLKAYPKSTKPVLGTTLQNLMSSFGDVNIDNLIQVKAIVPDVHGSIIPLPEDFSPQAIRSDGRIQQYLDLAPVFYSTSDSTQSLVEGAIIEIEFSDTDYTEGRIVSIVKSSSIFEAQAQKAKEAFDKANGGISNLNGSSDSAGDGAQINNLSIPTGKCGGRGDYEVSDCYGAPLEATGQTIYLHPKFWKEINDLVKKVKENTGLTLKIGEATRSQEQQLNIRKKRCPEWQGCVSEETLKTERWSNIISRCGCRDKTPVAAVTGPYASNHLAGLAVDFNMDMNCPASSVNKSAYDNCRNSSKVFNFIKRYVSSKVINFVDEPWHWSWNGK
jgi:hypothetical protein